MNVIVISGHAQHGKDTVANYCKEMLEADGNRVLIMHYADLLKFMCKEYFGWNGKKDKEGREILQHVGTDIVRIKEPNFWVDFIAKVLSFFPNEWDWVIIADARFPNEIEMLRNAGYNVSHVEVVRPNYESALTKEQMEHPSETSLDTVVPDQIIYNSGSLDYLRMLVKTTLWRIMYDK